MTSKNQSNQKYASGNLMFSTDIVDQKSYQNSVRRCRDERIVLPTFKQLAFPSEIPLDIKNTLQSVNKIDANPLNLFRVHWYNMWKKSTQASIPEYIELPSELTGVNARIVMILGNRFPMIDAHKVLAAYACLVPRIVSGRFDPTQQRAVWPSTGNYARGGIAISRLLRCRGVAVLPENMSQERFDWLERWVGEPEDIVRTPGSESNVKEIYDACQILAKDKRNIIVNQFSEFANHIIHYYASGIALEDIFLKLSQRKSKLRLAAFVAASGSSGTLGAGDWLKEKYESLIVAVEALECPTMLYNGYGEHNIQGIGDKHIPLIHNVMNTDLVAAISDRATDSLNLVFNSRVGKDYLRDELGLEIELVDQLRHFGLSSIANMLASVKVAKVLDLGPEDCIMSVATDGSELYKSEKEKFRFSAYPDGFTKKDVEKIIEERLINASPNHVEKLDNIGRNRIFNLGYFTWVEQQGVNPEDFEVRRTKQFWESMHDTIPIWDQCIREFNFEVGISD